MHLFAYNTSNSSCVHFKRKCLFVMVAMEHFLRLSHTKGFFFSLYMRFETKVRKMDPKWTKAVLNRFEVK